MQEIDFKVTETDTIVDFIGNALATMAEEQRKTLTVPIEVQTEFGTVTVVVAVQLVSVVEN